MALGTNHMTITTGDKFIPELWWKDVQLAAENNLVAKKLILNFEMGKGDTLHIPKVSNMSANAKAAGTAVTFQTFTEGSVDLSVNKHYEASFLLEDRLTATQNYALADMYKQKAVYGLTKQIDTDILALQSGLSQSVGTDNVAVTDAIFISAVQKLDEADAPMTDRNFICSPATKMDLIQIQRWASGDYVGREVVTNAEFGERYGVRLHVSNNVPAGTAGKINLLLHKEALAIGMVKDIEMQSQYFLDFLGTGYVAQVLYGVVEYRDAFGVTVLGK